MITADFIVRHEAQDIAHGHHIKVEAFQGTLHRSGQAEVQTVIATAEIRYRKQHGFLGHGRSGSRNLQQKCQNQEKYRPKQAVHSCQLLNVP